MLGRSISPASRELGEIMERAGNKKPSPEARSSGSLFVPGHNLYLTDDLAVAHIYGFRSEHTLPIWIFAGHVEREAIFAYDLVLNLMLQVSAKDIPQVLSYRLLTPQHIRRAWWSVAIDDTYLGVVGIEVEHRIEVVLLLGAAQGLEVKLAGGGLLFGHVLFSFLQLFQ